MTLNSGEVYQGDCLEVMKDIDDGSVDAILADLPYGTTRNKWDSIIDLDVLWKEYNRICKGVIVLTASQPFSSTLVSSNVKNFKYEWVWKKQKASNFLNSKIEPLKEHESVLVFKGGSRVYYPQGLIPFGKTRSRKSKNGSSDNYGNYGQENVSEWTNYPRTILEYNLDYPVLHPTQKPVALFEYLIRTYTNEGDLVLDNTAGSCTTAIAAINTNRRWICIEQEEKYVNIGRERIRKHLESRV